MFIEGTTQASIPFSEFVLQTMALAVLYTWLYNNTGGSVLVAALFNASANIAGAAIPTWTTELGRWVNFVLLLVIAGAVVWRYGWRQLRIGVRYHDAIAHRVIPQEGTDPT